MEIRLDELDSDTQDYLGKVWRQRGLGRQGLFQARSWSGPGWGLWRILGGLIALGIAVYLCWPQPSTPGRIAGKAALVAVGCLLLVAGFQARRARRRMRNPMGRFLYVDALYFWEVERRKVRVTPIDNAIDVNGTHHFQDGAYQRSEVVVQLPGSSLRRTLTNKRKAEDLLKYINALIHLRSSSGDPSLAALALEPVLLSAVAIQLVQGAKKIDLSGVSTTPPIPSPYRAGKPAGAGAPASAGRPWLVAAAAGGLALLGFWFLDPLVHDNSIYWQIPANLQGNVAPLERYLKEVPNGWHRQDVEERFFQETQANPSLLERYLACCSGDDHAEEVEEAYFARITKDGTFSQAALDTYLKKFPKGRHAEEVTTLRDHGLFAQISKVDDGNLAALDRYLAEYPAGWHTQEVRNLRDDRRFAQAKSLSHNSNSPLPLRGYISDETNVRHRRKAQDLINEFYEKAIQRLKGLANNKAKKVDPDLFALMLALLDTLKEIDTPNVLVVFRATQDPDPVTKEQKDQEKKEYDNLLQQNPAELKAIADRSLDGTAILPRGQVFDPEQTRRREQMILDRLREGINNVLAGDIITLMDAAGAPQSPLETPKSPILEVAYHVSPSGTLYTYTTTMGNPFGLPGAGTVKVNGLLRGYHADWTITLYPSLTAAPKVGKLRAAPLSQLKYDQKPGDPDWATYAILLYSSFHDLTTRLIESFALEAPKAPDTFSFQGVSGR